MRLTWILRAARWWRGFFVAGLGVAAAFIPSSLHSDAIVVTRAMLASTIAEISVEPDSVIVDLEIGADQMPAFRNLMPDEVHERLGFAPRDWADRLATFFTEDLVIREIGEAPLVGRLTALEIRNRIRRDEITGEPLPVPPDEAERVVFARLVYGTSGRPPALSFTPPGVEGEGELADLGFVVYHRSLPVNDFRYLGVRETLDLDWEDPWFSRFRNRNLWRQYDAPISAFLYIEPYEVRKEIVLRPRDLQEWADLGLGGMDTLRVEDQEDLKQRVVEFLAERNPVTIDGEERAGQLDRIHFIYRNLRTSGVIDPPRDVDLVSATLGVIWVYPVDGLPDEVAMRWELFSDRMPRVPAAATDEAGGLPYYLSPGDDVLRWRNFLTNPTIPGLVEVEQPPRGALLWLVLGGVAALAFTYLTLRYGVAAVRQGPVPTWAVAGAVVTFGLAAVLLPRGLGTTRLTEDETAKVLSGILLNVYRSFDFREEERIYDMLANSAAGDLLTDIYLETRRSLELENQGGARAKVKEVDVLDATYDRFGGGFVSRATWNVAGSVGHWGHIHRRINQYVAEFTVEEIDGVWKITSLEILEESRLPGSTV
jgi:hypothetical protein